jgi:hypothetical protein
MSTLRPPPGVPTRKARESAHESINEEIAAEKAGALGRVGRKAEEALARLRDFDAGTLPHEDRDGVLKAATSAVWNLFIQREVLGLRNQKTIIDEYQIPREVLRKLGS